MSLLPVCVVMSVFERAEHVRFTIESVLAQTGVEFEFVLIDDGATQSVKQVLEEYSDNSQIRVLRQSNSGLTKALINGCTAARHPLIARIDTGDIMLQDRLRLQAEVLSKHAEIGLVTSWVDFVTQEGYPLYQVRNNEAELTAGVAALEADHLITPVHASVMFRSTTYIKAGGYRKEFYFAQDCDLWSRLICHGEMRVIEKVLTKGLFAASGISGRYHEQQQKLKNLVAQSNRLRAQNLSDEPLLAKAKLLRPTPDGLDVHALSEFPALYFLARCLDKNRSKHAKEYWRRAISARPWNILVWALYLRSWFYRSE